MGFFTEGNLITLGIVLLILILYRQMDRKNRSMKLMRDYSEKLKAELGAFVKEQENAVKDYIIILKEDKASGKELLKQMQITEDEMAQKALSLARIDTQLKNYESSLAELDRMTSRVQENMNRVREESDFVDTAGKRIAQAKAKLEELEKNYDDIVGRIQRENTEALERAAEDIIDSVKSTISDLSYTTDNIERQIEDHRREINKAEESRAESMARDMEKVNGILADVIEKAGKRAIILEETALAKIMEQVEKRLDKVKTAEEDKIKSYQESAKTRVEEVRTLLKNIKEEWQSERANWKESDKNWKEEHKKEIFELNRLFTDSENRLNGDLASLEDKLEGLLLRAGELIDTQDKTLRSTVENTGLEIQRMAEEMKQKALEITGAKLEEYRSAQDNEFKRLEALAEDSRKFDS